MKLATFLLPVLAFSSMSFGGDLDILRGSTTRRDGNNTAPASAREIEYKVNELMKEKCDENGCALFVNDGSGNEFRVSIGGGSGPNYGGGYYGGGIVINNDVSSSDYMSATVTFAHSNFKCRTMVPEAVYAYINGYILSVSSPGYVSKVIKRAEQGEDTLVPEYVKMAFMTLATLKPTSQNCGLGNSGTNGRY
jgi:hypothetical protein